MRPTSYVSYIKVHFPRLKESDPIEDTDADQMPSIIIQPSKKKVEVVGVLTNVYSDQSVKLLVDSMIADEQTRMQIICTCINEFAKFYYKMKLTDWKRIIYAYLDETD